jgi:hypothetical protein
MNDPETVSVHRTFQSKTKRGRPAWFASWWLPSCCCLVSRLLRKPRTDSKSLAAIRTSVVATPPRKLIQQIRTGGMSQLPASSIGGLASQISQDIPNPIRLGRALTLTIFYSDPLFPYPFTVLHRSRISC